MMIADTLGSQMDIHEDATYGSQYGSRFWYRGTAPLLVGNWKMQGSWDMIKNFIDGLTDASTMGPGEFKSVLAFPSVYLHQARKWLMERGLLGWAEGTSDDVSGHFSYALAGQNCSSVAVGAYTGAISAAMLQDVGCTFVIVGHPERDWESAEDIRRQALQALSAGLKPLICLRNLEADLQRIPRGVLKEGAWTWQDSTESDFSGAHENGGGTDGESIGQCPLFLAYEPCVGAEAPPPAVEEAAQFLRGRYPHVGVLYGGGINEKTLAPLCHHFHGFLVGRASLNNQQWQQLREILQHHWKPLASPFSRCF